MFVFCYTVRRLAPSIKKYTRVPARSPGHRVARFLAGERASAPSAALTSTGRNPTPHPVASSGFPHSSSAWFRFTLCRPLCARAKIFVVGQSDGQEKTKKCAFERKPRFGAPLASRLSPLASLARERSARTDEEFHASDNTAFESTRAPPTNILNVMSRARARGLENALGRSERALERALDRFDRWTRTRRDETKSIDRSIDRARRASTSARQTPEVSHASSSRVRRADAVVEKRKPIRI